MPEQTPVEPEIVFCWSPSMITPLPPIHAKSSEARAEPEAPTEPVQYTVVEVPTHVPLMVTGLLRSEPEADHVTGMPPKLAAARVAPIVRSVSNLYSSVRSGPVLPSQ